MIIFFLAQARLYLGDRWTLAGTCSEKWRHTNVICVVPLVCIVRCRIRDIQFNSSRHLRQKQVCWPDPAVPWWQDSIWGEWSVQQASSLAFHHPSTKVTFRSALISSGTAPHKEALYREYSYSLRQHGEDSYSLTQYREDSYSLRQHREDSYSLRQYREDSYSLRQHREDSYSLSQDNTERLVTA